MHKDNKDHVSNLPFDKDLVNQDEKGSTVLCPHGEYPSYDAMDYQPENLIITRETPPPPVAPPPDTTRIYTGRNTRHKRRCSLSWPCTTSSW